MTDTPRDRLVKAIHNNPKQLMLVVTGGGSLAASDLLTTPGASRSVVEVVVPYSKYALAYFLGFYPEPACSAETARRMAARAFERAGQRRPDAERPFAGVACTASLASDRPKRGPHRLHVALHNAEQTCVASLTLKKGLRDRKQEERLAADLVLNLAARASGLPERLSLDLHEAEQVEIDECLAPPHWQALMKDQILFAAGGESPKIQACDLIYPGAFNPLHEGHRGIAEYASQKFSEPVAYEISIANVDKAAMDFIDMRERAKQFSANDRLVFTRAATFDEKSEVFPGEMFLAGVDTIERIDQPRYYGNSEAERDAAVARIAASGCGFLVFGRTVGKRFIELEDLSLSPALRQICIGVPEREFRADISSTDLREK